VKAIQPVPPGSSLPEIHIGERQDQYVTLPAVRVTDGAERRQAARRFRGADRFGSFGNF
jgi:hypothetical protein